MDIAIHRRSLNCVSLADLSAGSLGYRDHPRLARDFLATDSARERFLWALTILWAVFLWKGRHAALTIQDSRQVRPSDADPMIVKGVFGKSVGSNFGVRATSPGAVGILSEIPALDLGSERRFRFGHNCLLIRLLSVGRIDVVGAH